MTKGHNLNTTNMSQFAIYPLLFLSGAATLIYQIVWVRLLGLSISSTSVSVSIVVGTFFVGMALGSELTTRYRRLSENYFRSYLLAELLIAGSALILLPVLLNLDLLVTQLPFLGQYVLTKTALVVILLIVPTSCIGASLPLLVNALALNQKSSEKNLGFYYGVNTLGAVVGSIAVGFVLIPAWGLNGSVIIAVILNVSIVLLALYNRRYLDPAKQLIPVKSIAQHKLTAAQKRLLILLFITGYASLTFELVWTKYFSIYTHTTIYGLSAILAIFLAGISLGAMVLNRYIGQIKSPLTFLVFILIALLFSLLASRVAMEFFPTLINIIEGTNYTESNNATKYLLISIIIVVPTFLFGASFALCLNLICGDSKNDVFFLGRVYSINTLGSIIGVWLTGLWVIPGWGSNQALTIALLLLTSSLFLFFNISKLKPYLLSSFVIAIVTGNFLLPQLEYKNIISSSLYFFDRGDYYVDPTYLFVKEGRNGVVSVSTYDQKFYLLRKNNLTESAIYPPEIFNWRAETLLALMPYFLQHESKNAFIVGLGAGTTLTAASLSPLESIDLLEMDPVIEEASYYLYPDGIRALQDPRVNYQIDDARHRLLLDDKSYDMIISQPSHPWLSGNAHLFTEEYFRIVKSHLNDKGIFSLWLNLFNLDATTLKAIFRALYNVFPHGINFKIQDEGSLLLLASKQAIVFEIDSINQKMRSPAIAKVLSKWNIRNAYDLLSYFSLSRQEANQVAISSRPNTDSNLISEVRLANIRKFPNTEENPLRLLRDNFAFDITSYLPLKNRRQSLLDMQNYFSRRGDRYRQTLLARQIETLP